MLICKHGHGILGKSFCVSNRVCFPLEPSHDDDNEYYNNDDGVYFIII